MTLNERIAKHSADLDDALSRFARTTEWEEIAFFEPRWHGWARWEHALYTPVKPPPCAVAIREVLAKGWVRRPRGFQYCVFRGAIKASSPEVAGD